MEALDVFIVDDDQDFAESLGELLESEGHHVNMVHSGKQALEQFPREHYDIAFIDVKMPVMNGVDTMIALREKVPDAKIVMMTGYSAEGQLQQAMANGALGRLHKPIDMESLAALITRASANGTVLVADDDPDFSATIKELLEDEGYSVVTARTGQETIDTITFDGIDVLILDLNMPIKSGDEVLAQIAQRGRKLPTIVVTAYSGDDTDRLGRLEREKSVRSLSKPFDADELLNAVRLLNPRH